MCECIRRKRPIESFSDLEKNMWGAINGRYAHASDDGYMVPDILVITRENLERIHQLFSEHKNYNKLLLNITEAYKNVDAIFKRYSHKVLHDNLGFNIRMELYDIRMMAVHDLVDDNILKLPEDPSKSSLGMHIFLS